MHGHMLILINVAQSVLYYVLYNIFNLHTSRIILHCSLYILKFSEHFLM